MQGLQDQQLVVHVVREDADGADRARAAHRFSARRHLQRFTAFERLRHAPQIVQLVARFGPFDGGARVGFRGRGALHAVAQRHTIDPAKKVDLVFVAGHALAQRFDQPAEAAFQRARVDRIAFGDQHHAARTVGRQAQFQLVGQRLQHHVVAGDGALESQPRRLRALGFAAQHAGHTPAQKIGHRLALQFAQVLVRDGCRTVEQRGVRQQAVTRRNGHLDSAGNGLALRLSNLSRASIQPGQRRAQAVRTGRPDQRHRRATCAAPGDTVQHIGQAIEFR